MIGFRTNNEQVEAILQQPRHPDMICDEDGSRPLMLASDRGHAEVVRLLLEAGADKKLGRQLRQHRSDASIKNRPH